MRFPRWSIDCQFVSWSANWFLIRKEGWLALIYSRNCPEAFFVSQRQLSSGAQVLGKLRRGNPGDRPRLGLLRQTINLKTNLQAGKKLSIRTKEKCFPKSDRPILVSPAECGNELRDGTRPRIKALPNLCKRSFVIRVWSLSCAERRTKPLL